jgi:hypothetical protein
MLPFTPDADPNPDPTFQFDADTDPDATFQFDPDPDPTTLFLRLGPSNALKGTSKASIFPF